VKFGFSVPTWDGFHERALGDLASEAEAAGWDGFFLWDHILWDPPGQGLADTTVALAAVALATERIRFGALVTPLPRRRPWKFARETMSLDRMSAGRLVVGVGLGADFEFAPLAEPTPARLRAELLEEGLEVVTRFWSGEPFTYEGRHYRVDDVGMLPATVQQPRPPVWVGFWWPNRAPARRAAQWDGIVPLNGSSLGEPMSPEDVRACVDYVHRHRRDEAPLDVVVSPHGGDPGPYAEAGATWWIGSVGPEEPVETARERIGLGPPR
jgi:alkanesulfonate monooxygenase SsuD/methylene tetrahydromethanopterin reductase-like flavin-dependent oxidoreductase (luciferase family)